jgi:cell division protein FtsW (lipid II flippase)
LLKEGTPPQINLSKIPGDAGTAGAIFAISTVLIFLIGIPALRYFLPAAIVSGCGIAFLIYVIRRCFRHPTPGAPWILSDGAEKRPPLR